MTIIRIDVMLDCF